ncbi:hypothetical protein Q4512_02885 [Oceanihabitans sp. 2_MG-2023]|uniref:hypothetical protein n=1 Tax=Oceanihabitans sp. 2_MG-2023 TaxID=3062661 RepID=UPI0026E2555E|nr:hypothetical protein [Oceanihabitans sp. 2_MG-2023]MDO6595842.1 hypothetical protein [Oceanihabitans sp. 2_MG-2023]
MKNKLQLLFLLFFSCSLSFAQDKTALKEEALRDAKITSEATLKMDFKTVLKHTHPSVIKLMGGEEQALNLVETTFESINAQGIVFEKADVISVSDVVFEQDEYRCLVEGYNQMKMPGMRIKSKSHLLGFYNAQEKFWYFIEAEKMNNQTVAETLFPGFETNMEIPNDTMESEEIED